MIATRIGSDCYSLDRHSTDLEWRCDQRGA